MCARWPIAIQCISGCSKFSQRLLKQHKSLENLTLFFYTQPVCFCVLMLPECCFCTNICLEVQPDHTYDKPRLDVISVYGGPSSPLRKDEKIFRALSGVEDKRTWKYVTVHPWQGYSLDSSHTFLPTTEFIRIINPSDVYVAVCST